MRYKQGTILYYINYGSTGIYYEVIKNICKNDETCYLLKGNNNKGYIIVPQSMIDGDDKYNSRFFTTKEKASQMHDIVFKKASN